MTRTSIGFLTASLLLLGCDPDDGADAVSSATDGGTDDGDDDDNDDDDGTTSSGTTGDSTTGDSTTGDSTTGDSTTSTTTTGDDPCLACAPQAECVNDACVCPTGYTGDGTSCTDVDECTSGTANCDANAMCSNSPGGFTCTCNSGFEGNGQTCAPSTTCADSPCSPFATCTNTQTGVDCLCNDGFEGDGFTCTGTGAYGASCQIAEVCASGLCVGPPYDACSVLCNQAVANDCANVGAAGFCVSIGNDEFACVGDLDTGIDTDDDILSVGDSATRALDTLTDADLFQLELTPGSFVILATPATDDDVELSIYNGIGQQVALINQAGPGEFEGTILDNDGSLAFAVVRNVGTSTGQYTISVMPE